MAATWLVWAQLAIAVDDMNPARSKSGECPHSASWPDAAPSPPDAVNPIAIEALEGRWSQGPNFACTAVLATWSCGSGCAGGVIVDAASGGWYELPFVVHRTLEQVQPLLDYSLERDVLVVTGWVNEQGRVRRRVFRWDGYWLGRRD